jgi:LacI family transcriptional regulator
VNNNRVTIADIAVKAGVSKGAAWAALTDRKTSIVLGTETRKKILRLAKELNYQPNLTARSLATQKSYLIGFLCRETHAKTTSVFLRGMQERLLDEGYSVLVYAHGDSVEDEACNLRHAIARQTEALIITPAIDKDGACNTQAIKSLLDSGTPVIQLFSRQIDGIASISADHYLAGKIAVEHLLEKGHRRIAHLTIEGYRDEEMPGYFFAVKKRWQGYEDAMKHAGLEPEVLTIDPEVDYARGAFDVAKSVSNHSYHPTAIVAYNDTMALGLMKGLTLAGVRVPQDMSIIGHDGAEQLLLATPLDETITTFIQPIQEIGRIAAKMCTDLIDGKKVEDVVYKNKFHQGNSVASL